MDDKELEQVKSIFENYPEIKLGYFFGSKATNSDGPLSDYDFAVYFDERDAKKMFELRLVLMDQLSNLFKTDKIDVVVLNTIESPELKFNVIKEGRLIFEREPYKVIVEPRILNEYFDFRDLLLKFGLTKS
ncbi:MAG: nucleotidyltransferase domain-containing protein [Candidatus Azambacteria bacterium]|nr:nucleotidyltransferase domain-containing protein [Candidatus Azambacteria bacterium]